jgi:outer membrane protein OmpA-like peptidoglycan-associated protein
MKLWKTIPFATALLVLQAQGAPPTNVPLYRVTVVQGSAKAINYRNLKRSTEIELKGTVLAQIAEGEARIKSDDGKIEIKAKFKHLPAASSFGDGYLTYVLWGISTEGRATNLGEILVKDGKGKVDVVETLQTFGLIVTAEPYFAVSQPSDVVVMENAIGKEAIGQVELIDAKFELLKRGQYTLNMPSAPAAAMDEHTPFDVYQARNAVLIARASGAASYAPEPFAKAEGYLQAAENTNEGKKARTIQAREAIQRAEDARLISVQRQAADQVALEARLAQNRLDDARRATELAQANADAAKRQAQVAEHNEANSALATQQAEGENEGLRARLLEQFNQVLQTRATAKGLIVNMSGVLFENGKATLQPAAREKLAKIAGILASHKGLRLEADGFTDSNGSDAFNQKLSEARAKGAMDYLVSQGVAADMITSKGFGEGNPIADNATAAGRQENRRVELVVSGAGLTAVASISH